MSRDPLSGTDRKENENPALGYFKFGHIQPEESEQAIALEQACFPPNEACSPQHMRERIEAAPELFLVARDRRTGRIAGSLNGLATDEEHFRDEFFTDASLQDPHGRNIMLTGLAVFPEYRGQGLARELMREYVRRAEKDLRRVLILTCLDSLVPMYEKFGFQDEGLSASTWGGEPWHEMTYRLKWKNPRFQDEALGTLRQPDIHRIYCRTCTWREEDRMDGKIRGATLGVCQVYSVKPYDILWKGVRCPYYVKGPGS